MDISKYQPDDWVDTETASKIIGFTAGTMRTWRYVKRGPVFSKVGRVVRYRVRDLQEFMEDRLCL